MSVTVVESLSAADPSELAGGELADLRLTRNPVAKAARPNRRRPDDRDEGYSPKIKLRRGAVLTPTDAALTSLGDRRLLRPHTLRTRMRCRLQRTALS
ncbi:hypothetical protein GCM10009529_20680 [Micropruina glycogenica]